jgi:ATP-dependent protease ClpP protease subunit
MARDDRDKELPPKQLPQGLQQPQISLLGRVDETMARALVDQLAQVPDGDGPVVVEITTLGGDPEFARRMVLEIDLARERLKPRRLVFLGKTVVYSAGATMMAAFPPEDRFLTADATLLIHCRQQQETVELSGPIRASLPKLRALCHQMETGIALEEQNFERLIAGSSITMDDLLEKALYNWYVPGEEAVKLGLVAALVP